MRYSFSDRQVRVFAPATVANLGLGFDVLGMALDEPGDVVTARLCSAAGVHIKNISGDGGVLSADAAKNTAGIAARATLLRSCVEVGVELELEKGLPIGSGLGSSASSAAAAAYAVNLLLGAPLRKTELIEPCIEAEAAVAGRHADNVAPAILGGLILVRSIDPLDLVRLPLPEELTLAVVTPKFELSTRKAREVLPQCVPLSDLVHNTANIAAIVSACYAGDLALLARCLPDKIITPVRAELIPGCMQVIEAALDTGALGSSISGSGPSVFAICRSRQSAEPVAEAMRAAFAGAGLESTRVISNANCPGVRRL